MSESLIKAESSPINLMSEIARGDADLASVQSDDMINRSKLFLVAQSQNELRRIVKMTEALDRIENQYLTAIEEKLEDNPENISIMASAMEVLSRSLERSQSIVQSVLGDEQLKSIVINTTQIISNDGSAAVIMGADSRDAVRNCASGLLAMLTNGESKVIDESGD